MNILICEDDAGLRALWSEVFGQAGHDVVAVAGSQEARKALMTARFSVMILDLYLGDDNGLSVATLAAYANPDCKIVITTGSTLFAKGELFAMAPSVAAVLRKPVSNQELLAVAEHGLKAAS